MYNPVYIFDVDGTLTPSRQPIDPEFKRVFLRFCKNYKVWLISGSDYKKTEEQLGTDICMSVEVVYSCSGNATYKKGNLLDYIDNSIPKEIISWCDKKVKETQFPIKRPPHIEHRFGGINFSILGRSGDLQDREIYKWWDDAVLDRKKLIEEFTILFPSWEICIGGETGVDITPIGRGKEQIAKFIPVGSVFYGDATFVGGNDYKLAQEIKKLSGTVVTVNSWTEVQPLIESLNKLKLA